MHHCFLTSPCSHIKEKSVHEGKWAWGQYALCMLGRTLCIVQGHHYHVGSVVEDKPTELSCNTTCTCTCMFRVLSIYWPMHADTKPFSSVPASVNHREAKPETEPVNSDTTKGSTYQNVYSCMYSVVFSRTSVYIVAVTL